MTAFSTLPKGATFRMPDDSSGALLEKTGPTTYRVVGPPDHAARGLKFTASKADPVLRLCGHPDCAETCAMGCTWTDENPTCSRCKCTRPEDA